MTVGRALVAVSLGAAVLAGCTSGTAKPPTSGTPSVTTIIAEPPSDGWKPPKAFDAKYHDSQTLCAALQAHLPRIAAFSPTKVVGNGQPGDGGQNCRLDDEHDRHIAVSVVAFGDERRGGTSALTFNEMTAKDSEPVSGIGDRAAMLHHDGSTLAVLNGNNFYLIVVNMDAAVSGVPRPTAAEIEDVEKQIALAIV
ncbi:hypothetical protein [Actinocrispum wychmicini]|uniref:DUF3558 domain-containing protein n=1 Tax=Actinocrispum wychmicini TaxID=1213861 RepID=A0A4R2IUR9_9PSEU|nr:hypothetical protein [Actinocrispum wychmicini]TCO46685.1 hypothetical protein EV192_11880 [Actinocrispum wychmicini]